MASKKKKVTFLRGTWVPGEMVGEPETEKVRCGIGSEKSLPGDYADHLENEGFVEVHKPGAKVKAKPATDPAGKGAAAGSGGGSKDDGDAGKQSAKAAGNSDDDKTKTATGGEGGSGNDTPPGGAGSDTVNAGNAGDGSAPGATDQPSLV